MTKFKKSQLFLVYNLLFIIGVAAGFLINITPFYLYVVFLFFLITSIAFYKKYFLKIIPLGCCFLILGLWRYNINLFKMDKSQIGFYNNSEIEFIGIVTREPDARINHVELIVDSKNIIDKYSPNAQPKILYPPKMIKRIIKGKVLITTTLYPEFNYGDELKIKCRLQTPKNFDNFAYDKYLARYNIYSVCYYPKIKLLSTDNGNKFYSAIYKFKNRFRLIIDKTIAEPQSALLSAIILGTKRGIPKELIEKFNRVGISHIIAISGMHIGILAIILMYLGIMLGLYRNQSFYFSSIILFLYILLIGFPPSAARAGIMGFLALLAMRLCRIAKAINALLFAAAVMLLFNPLLIYDIGFQLSFLAILGLIYILPILEKITATPPTRGFGELFKKSPLTRWIVKQIITLLIITISAQIATLPIILYHFGRLSLIAPLANILIVPFLPFIMVLGLILLIGGLIWIGLARAVGWIVWFILSYLIRIVNFLSKFKFSSVNVKIEWWLVAILYIAIGRWIVKNQDDNLKI